MAGMASPAAYARLAELATMTVAGRLIEGHVPTLQDFTDNAVLLVGMHMGIKGVGVITETRGRLYDIYKNTGLTPDKVVQEVDAKVSIEEINNPSLETLRTVLEEIQKEAEVKIKETQVESPSETKITEEQRTTGTKNAVTTAEREARGLTEVESEIRRVIPAFEEAKRQVDSGEIDPRGLARQVAAKPRAVSDIEDAALKYDRMRISNEQTEVRKVIEKEMTAGNMIAEAEAREKLYQLEEDYNTNDIASKVSGTEWSASGRMRQQMVQEDYSLAAMLQRARTDNGGKAISKAMRAELEKYSKKIEEAAAKLKDYEEQLEQVKAETALKRIKSEVDLEKRSAKRTYKKQELSEEFAGLTKELNTVLSGQFNMGIDPLAIVILGKMAKNRVHSGIITVEGVIDALYTEVKNMGADLSKREIRDAISGYGKIAEMSKKTIDVQMRDLRRQMRLISALEDARVSEQPLKSGLQRESESETVKDLRKQVKDEMLKQGLRVTKERTDEQLLQTYKTRTQNKITELEGRLERGDFATKPKREFTLDPDALNLKYELDKQVKAYSEARFKDQLSKRTTAEKVGAGVTEALNLSRAIKTSFDVSAVLRQGAFIVFAHPIRGAKIIPDMFRALLSEKGQFKIDQEILSRPNYALYEESKLYLAEHGQKLSQMEEVYMSRLVEKISVVAASQRAYTTFLNKLRADSFDVMVENLSSEKPTPKELNAIANFINVATGRGNIGAKENALVGLNTIFFAPRYVASRFQLLAGQPFYRGTAETRMMVAKEYGRFLIGLGVVYSLGLAMGADIELDPRSTDFGKMKFGSIRLDPLAGLSQTTVLLSRLITGETLTTSGNIIPIRGDQVPYGHANSTDVIARFLRSKLSPVVGVGVDITAGKDYVGNVVTIGSVPERLLAPLAFNDIYDSMKEVGVPAGAALGVLSLFGMGLQQYEPGVKKETTMYDEFFSE